MSYRLPFCCVYVWLKGWLAEISVLDAGETEAPSTMRAETITPIYTPNKEKKKGIFSTWNNFHLERLMMI